MANSDNRSNQFAKYDNMSTEELQQILRDDASIPEGQESNMDELFYVMDVLASRRKARDEGKTPEEALESFKQYYDPEINHASSPVSEKALAGNKSSKGYWKRCLIAAAVTLVILISCTITAEAWGFDLWDTVAKWTQETFYFGYLGQTEETNAPTPDHSNPCGSLQDMLETYYVSANLVPSWLPEGYTEQVVDLIQTPRQRQYFAIYQKGDSSISIYITDYLSNHPTQIEQSTTAVEIYSVNGIDYYIFDNWGQLNAAWINETYECSISGPLSIEELKAMIDSIEKG